MSGAIKYLAFLIAILTLNQEVVISFHLSMFLYYAIMVISFTLIFIKSKNIEINVLLILFIIVAIYGLLIKDIPSVFKAPQRLLGFIIVSGLCGPLISSEYGYMVRQKIFVSINRLLIIAICISCFTYFLHINISGTVLWAGIFTQSMTIAPLAGITLLILLYLYHSNIRSINKKYQILLIMAGIVISFITLLLASSRSAIVGVFSGILFFYYKLYQGRLSQFLSVIIILVLIVLATLPLWYDFTTGIKEKMADTEAAGDLVVSRREFWGDRKDEFLSSPLLGIGFATADLFAIGVDADSGTIEPGSSWMSILSMVGILGLIPIVLLFIKLIRYLIRDNDNSVENAVLGGILFLFITHMFAEGYFLFPGSFLFFYIWLLLGVIDGLSKFKSIVIV